MQEFSAAFTAENVEFHKRILGAFQAGDAELAKRVMYDHMLSAETIVLPADAQAQQSFFAKPLGLD
jgi:DNA-binding FadR family transcriptional regulator